MVHLSVIIKRQAVHWPELMQPWRQHMQVDIMAVTWQQQQVLRQYPVMQQQQQQPQAKRQHHLVKL
jgi:hypothetical protein